jgi:predicted RNA-binding protein with PUA-like domain
VEPWDGVTAPAALKMLREAQPGEPCVIYHTGGERRAVGLATVVRAAYPDPNKSDPKLVAIDVSPGPELPRPVTLDQLKVHPTFAGSRLVREGRLSVVPLTDEQYDLILTLSGLASG